MKGNKLTTSISIMTLFFISMGIAAITPALQNIAEAFPDIPMTTIMLISTLPSLAVIPATVVAGAVAGSKVGYRALALIGCLLFTLGGIAPYIFPDFTAILVARAIFGIGLGIMSPLGNALIFRLIEGPKIPNMMGMGTVIMNVGGIVIQMLAGILCAVNWKLTFLAHLVGAVAFLIFFIWLPEPEKLPDMPKGEKATIPVGVYLLSAVFGLMMMMNYPLLLNMSTLIVAGNLGNAAATGAVLSMWTVGGMVAGALFGTAFKFLKRFTIPVALLLCTIGLAICTYANTLFLLTVGATTIGFAFSIVMPAFMMDLNAMVAPSAVAAAISILMAAMNVGGFISTFYMGAVVSITGNTDIRFLVLISTVFYLAAAVVYGIVKAKAPAAAPAEHQHTM